MQPTKIYILPVRNIFMTICKKLLRSLCNWNEFIWAQSVPNTPTHTVVPSQELGFKSKYSELLCGQDVMVLLWNHQVRLLGNKYNPDFCHVQLKSMKHCLLLHKIILKNIYTEKWHSMTEFYTNCKYYI